jgi:hypothetical protein
MVDQYISRPTVPTNGEDAAPEAPRDEPTPIAEAAAGSAHAWAPEPESDGPPLRGIMAIGGALLLIAGVAGWLFARSRRRPSRGERVADAVRGTAMAAGAMAGSLGGVAALRAAVPSRKQIERRARQASKAAHRAREAMPR